jgi:hypothetical protein
MKKITALFFGLVMLISSSAAIYANELTAIEKFKTSGERNWFIERNEISEDFSQLFLYRKNDNLFSLRTTIGNNLFMEDLRIDFSLGYTSVDCGEDYFFSSYYDENQTLRVTVNVTAEMAILEEISEDGTKTVTEIIPDFLKITTVYPPDSDKGNKVIFEDFYNEQTVYEAEFIEAVWSKNDKLNVTLNKYNEENVISESEDFTFEQVVYESDPTQAESTKERLIFVKTPNAYVPSGAKVVLTAAVALTVDDTVTETDTSGEITRAVEVLRKFGDAKQANWNFRLLDLVTVQKIASGNLIPVTKDFEKYDYNGDNVITALDYAILKRKYLQL